MSDDAVVIDADPLSDEEEILYRQVHPDLWDRDQPSSSVFMPNPKDEGQLSVDRSALTSPKDACTLYLSTGRHSVAVVGLSVGEFGKEQLDCFSDPLTSPPEAVANPAHARVDYNGLGSNSQRKKVAKRLKVIALARGILHQV